MELKSCMWYGILASLMLILGTSCDDKIEDCLDPIATNFAADADIDCCCTYPTFSLDLFYLLDTTNFALERVFDDADGAPYYLTELSFFLHDFVLEDSLGNTVIIQDTLAFTSNDGTSYEVPADHQIIDLPTSSYELGTSRASGKYNNISFKFGLAAADNNVDITTISSTNVLADQADSMYLSATQEHILFRMKVVRDSFDVGYEHLYELTGSENTQAVSVPVSFEVSPNENFSLSLELNMEIMFDGVAFQTDSKAEVMGKIVENVTNAFKARE